MNINSKCLGEESDMEATNFLELMSVILEQLQRFPPVSFRVSFAGTNFLFNLHRF
jgi:hypothetical protein